MSEKVKKQSEAKKQSGGQPGNKNKNLKGRGRVLNMLSLSNRKGSPRLDFVVRQIALEKGIAESEVTDKDIHEKANAMFFAFLDDQIADHLRIEQEKEEMAQAAEDEAFRRDFAERIAACSSLDERETKALDLRYGLSDGQTRTYAQVGKELAESPVTRSYAHQVIRSALAKLKQQQE